MKLRTCFFHLVLVLFEASLCSAQVNQTMGTWKTNEAKSKFPAHFMRVDSDSYQAIGDTVSPSLLARNIWLPEWKVKATTDATGPDGQHLHIEWLGKFNSKDYPCTGDPTGDTRSYSGMDEHTFLMRKKKNGQTVITAKIVIAPDGKSRTIYITGTDSSGNPVSATVVQDKE